MDIIITNKASYAFIFLLVLFVLVLGAGAAVNINGAYHTLQQIVNPEGVSVDNDGDGIIDLAEHASSFVYSSVTGFPGLCPDDRGVPTFVVGMGSAFACSPAWVDCKEDFSGVFSCALTFSPVPISSSGGVVYGFVPEFASYDSGAQVLWVNSRISDTEAMLVKFDCSSDCSISSIRKLSYPRQIAIGSSVFVGSESPSNSVVYSLSDAGCSESMPKTSPKGIAVSGDEVFVSEGSAIKKYNLDMTPAVAPNTYSDAAGSFSDLGAGTFGSEGYIFARYTDGSNADSVAVIKAGDLSSSSINQFSFCSSGLRLGGLAVDDINNKLYVLCEQIVIGTERSTSTTLWKYDLTFANSPSVSFSVSNSVPLHTTDKLMGTPSVSGGVLVVPHDGRVDIFNAPPSSSLANPSKSVSGITLAGNYESGCG